MASDKRQQSTKSYNLEAASILLAVVATFFISYFLFRVTKELIHPPQLWGPTASINYTESKDDIESRGVGEGGLVCMAMPSYVVRGWPLIAFVKAEGCAVPQGGSSGESVYLVGFITDILIAFGASSGLAFGIYRIAKGRKI